ncbi:MAG TPA: SusC/RagA family TonB-linked outer membrane protein, partial [Chitinophagaceae bacterium]|nr:SusC/RagA family TonB-linked outer membrane protein [Chitinophagaceae bacterium]
IYHPEHMGLEDFLNLENVAAVNVGKPPKHSEEEIQKWVNATDRYKYPLPNVWFDYYLNPAPQQNHTLSVGGGSDRLKTLLTLNYFHQKGIIPNSYGNKKDIRLNTDFKVSKRITLSGDFNYRLKEYTRPLHEENSFRYMLSGSNFAVPRYPDGTYGLGSENYSPLVTNELDGISHYRNNYGVINLKAKINLLKGLNFQTQYGAKLIEYYEKDFANAYEIHDYYNPANILKSVGPNSLTEKRNDSKEYTLNNLLTYDAHWDKHTLNALAGYSQISYVEEDLSASRTNFYNNDVRSISQGSADSRDNGGGDLAWGLRSYFGRLTYNFNEKYYFEANARYDGSSRFTGDKKYSFFPSFSGAWRISQEAFWSSLSNVVNEFKLRGSWGKSGNQAVDLYSYFQTLAASNYNFGGAGVQGIIQSTLANEALTWETTAQSDIGVDAQLFKGKLGFTFDYYIKKTDGILLNLPIPATVGLNAPPQNAGVVQNKGWELSVNYKSNINDFHYSIAANLSNVNNKILSLANTGPYIGGNPNEVLTIRKEGLPIDAYIGYKTLGFFKTADDVKNYPVFDPATQVGDVKYADVNGDGAINSEDYIVIGSSIPRYTFGVTLNLEFKNFDLNLFLQGVGKANGIPSGAFREQGNWGGFTLALEKDYWTPDHTDAKFPRPESETIRNSQMSDFWMINTAYLKLKNLQIGYTLPTGITKRFDINTLRVYVSGSNLLTFSQATKWGLDPEFPSGRLNYY